MKTQILLVLILFIATQNLKAQDTISPVITLNGTSPVYQILNTPYTDPGFTAFDNQDGNVTAFVQVTGSVNINLTGDYILTYSVSDMAGNPTFTMRTVRVYNEADSLACGTYTGTDSCDLSGSFFYTSTITSSATVNKRIWVQNFSGFSVSLYMDVSGTSAGSTISWPAQTIGSIGTLLASTNGGTIINLSPITISFTYQWNDGTTTESCWGTYTGSCFTAINEIRDIYSFSVFPNPFSSTTTIRTDIEYLDATLTIYNASGQQVKQIKNIYGQSITLYRDNLPPGLYFIRLTQDNKTFMTKKLIITD